MGKEKKFDPKKALKEVELGYGSIEAQVKFLQGRILTIIDASYQNNEQKRAVKDLINKEFSANLNWLYDLTHNTQSLGDRELVQVDVKKTLEAL